MNSYLEIELSSKGVISRIKRIMAHCMSHSSLVGGGTSNNLMVLGKSIPSAVIYSAVICVMTSVQLERVPGPLNNLSFQSKAS